MKDKITKLVKSQNILQLIIELRKLIIADEGNELIYDLIKLAFTLKQNISNKHMLYMIKYHDRKDKNHEEIKIEKELVIADIIIIILLDFFDKDIKIILKDKLFDIKDDDKSKLINLKQHILVGIELEPLVPKNIIEKIHDYLILNAIDRPQIGYIQKLKDNKLPELKYDENFFNWYAYCAAYSKKLEIKINGQSSIKNYFNILISKKKDKTDMIFPKLLANCPILNKNDELKANEFIKPLLTKETDEHKRLKKIKYRKRKKIKDELSKKVNSLLDSESFPQDEYIEIMNFIANNKNSETFYQDLCQQLPKIRNNKNSEFKNSDLLNKKDLKLYWNQAIKKIIIKAGLVASDSEKTVAHDLALISIQFIDLGPIDQKLIEFYENNSIEKSLPILFGSRATEKVMAAFNIKPTGFKTNDYDIMVSIALGQKDKNDYATTTFYFKGDKFDVVQAKPDRLMPNQTNDSFKSFGIRINQERYTLIASLKNLRLLFQRDRKFDLQEPNAKLLAYYMREAAKNPLSFSIDSSYGDFIKNKSLTTKRAIAIFLTKYVKNTKDKLFTYFQTKLLPIIQISQEDQSKIIKIIGSIIEKTQISFNNINLFAPLYLFLIKIYEKREIPIELFPNKVKITYNNMITYFQDLEISSDDTTCINSLSNFIEKEFTP